jgi:uroporphyrinogen decarboxylase
VDGRYRSAVKEHGARHYEESVNYRDLFHQIMHYGSFDRMPVIHWDVWPETRERWVKQGFPVDLRAYEFLGAVPSWMPLVSPVRDEDADPWMGTGSQADDINLGLFPTFEKEIFEETAEYRVFRAPDGVITKAWRSKSSIPLSLDYTLKDAGGWDEYKKRLQPDPARVAPDIDERLRAKEAFGLPLCFPAASLMGWVRNWMGVENMSYLMYDDRDVYVDMVMTIADLVCWGIDQILPKVKVDLAHTWEDICGSTGPLVSPKIFDECVAPGYTKIRDKLREYEVGLYEVDSDGDLTALAGHWLDAGVNMLFPLEVGTFRGDARELRKRYGRELRLFGNFDKRALAQGREAIEAEIERLLPLMGEGGFIIMPDHLIPPDVDLADYRWYLDRIRELSF